MALKKGHSEHDFDLAMRQALWTSPLAQGRLAGPF